MRPIVAAGLYTSAAIFVLAGVAGLVFGTNGAIAVLACGFALVVAYHLWHLHRLERWAAGPVDAPVPDARGPWQVGFTALYRRVRDRTAYQRRLTDTIQRFQEATDAVPDGMVVLDSANRVRWLNRRAQGHLGLERDKDVGRPVANVARQPELVRYLDRGDFSDAVVVESTREPGVVLSIQVVPFGEDERLLISRDVTKLQAVERMRRDFIANVSHELKTPLTVVAGFIETLQDLDVDDASRRRYMQLMGDQARNMQRLVADLLTLSTLESQGHDMTATWFAVRPLLRELATEARALSAGTHVLELEEGPEAEIEGSRDELRSAFANLISNAVRYTLPGGRITVAWRIDADGAGLYDVTDTGIGIAPEHLPRLTERFYRVDRSRSRATGGTGLGLAIVKHVVLRHDAELLIASEPGCGSTFTVKLPPWRVKVGAGAARNGSTERVATG